ncbi:MAG: CPBP family glutamic-type intramembrane protease [Nitrospiraceae bacterium]
MTGPAGRASSPLLPPERAAGLVLLPILSTLFFYLAPLAMQNHVLAQFLPQVLSYVGLLVWASLNSPLVWRLGLQSDRLASGLVWGAAAGAVLGAINTLVILTVAPWLGYDITFLTQTPHARVPLWLMIPWFICVIAIFVELNFRGFILGRLLALSVPPPLAVLISALLFSFDPFMVATFKYLHWIAVWDGIVWGMMWIRLGNLYAVITAHALEVIIMYSLVRAALS